MSPRRSPSSIVGPGAPARLRAMGVTIRHPGKIWWPDEGITKLDVVRFYAGVAPRLRPWLMERPLVAERCPDGLRGECFFQKNFPKGLPADVPTTAITGASTGRTVHYVVGGSTKTLLALVNLGCIAIHVMNTRRRALQRPDWLAFDLDPGSGAFADAARAGRLLREILDDLRLRSYPKTSGGAGSTSWCPCVPARPRTRCGASRRRSAACWRSARPGSSRPRCRWPSDGDASLLMRSVTRLARRL